MGNEAVRRSQIRSIVFVDSLESAKDGAWDVSASGDGSTLAWVEDGKLTVAGRGGVTGPSDSRGLFSGYSYLESIAFNNCFLTEGIEDISDLFAGCGSLTSLDLSGFDTGNVTDMGRMFWGCSSLNTITISERFVPGREGRAETTQMFENCPTTLVLNGQVMTSDEWLARLSFDGEQAASGIVQNEATQPRIEEEEAIIPTISNAKAAVDWADPALAEAMKEQTGIKKRAITFEDVAGIETLNLSRKGISDISALVYIPHLKTLWLSGNAVGDISVLKNLTELETLWLDGNALSDISALSNLEKLETLWLSNNNISDISALGNLKNLKFLLLDHNEIRDIISLSRVTSLRNLALNSNDIYDASALSPLTRLESLDLSDNQISDISPLTALVNLKTLKLDDNAISDIHALEALDKLEILSLRNNSVNNIDSLSSLNGLIKLDLSGNVIRDYSPIEGLNIANMAK